MKLIKIFRKPLEIRGRQGNTEGLWQIQVKLQH